MQNLKKTILSSAYPTDKIAFTKKASVNIATLGYETGEYGGSLHKIVIPHGHPRPLFVDFRYSIDSGTTWRVGSASADAIAYSTATNIVIVLREFLTSGTFMYEVYGTWIDNYDSTNPLISTISIPGKVFFDSRNNYRKIAKQGSGTASPVDAYNDQLIVNHTIGSAPKFICYFESRPGQIWQQMGGGVQNPWYFDFAMSEMFSRSTPTQLIIDVLPPYPYRATKVYYKVFGDG